MRIELFSTVHFIQPKFCSYSHRTVSGSDLFHANAQIQSIYLLNLVDKQCISEGLAERLPISIRHNTGVYSDCDGQRSAIVDFLDISRLQNTLFQTAEKQKNKNEG